MSKNENQSTAWNQMNKWNSLMQSFGGEKELQRWIKSGEGAKGEKRQKFAKKRSFTIMKLPNIVTSKKVPVGFVSIHRLAADILFCNAMNACFWRADLFPNIRVYTITECHLTIWHNREIKWQSRTKQAKEGDESGREKVKHTKWDQIGWSFAIFTERSH